MWAYNSPHELYHYGILGQKWGVRRYQNEDGSLTPAGEKRYNEQNSTKARNRSNKRKWTKKKAQALIAAGAISTIGLSAAVIGYAAADYIDFGLDTNSHEFARFAGVGKGYAPTKKFVSATYTIK